MGRLRWGLLVLCLLLFLLMGTTVLYARTLPAPGPAHFDTAGLSECNSRLCLFRITPGITSWDEAKSALASYITRDDGDHVHGQVGSAAIRVEMDNTGMQTSAIEVQGSLSDHDPLALHFGQVIEHFGTPCYVSGVDADHNSIMLEYPSFTVQLLTNQNQITLDSPVGALTLRTSADAGRDQGRCTNNQGGIPWHGFASLREYDTLLQNGWQDTGN